MSLILKKRSFPQLKIFFVIVFSVLLILSDSKFNKIIKIRVYLDSVISPIYYLINSTNHFLNNILKTLIKSSQLISENQILRKELLLKSSEQILLDQYKQENANLRALLGSPLIKGEKRIVSEVIYVNNNLYNYRVIIDKGSKNGVYVGQPVINDQGIIGQVISVSKLTSVVLLICDKSHFIPAQVLRNNIRVIINGNGLNKDLQMEHLPINIDIKVGDIIVTSGLGGCFPEGYLVGVVSSVEKDIKFSFTNIKVHTSANLNNLHYLLLLWNINLHNKEIFSNLPDKIHKIATYRLKKSHNLKNSTLLY